jgi:predicted GIY-YIG superfamily endonuclease
MTTEIATTPEKVQKHYCYILYNDFNTSTYNGYTVNLERRLRQHNCEIKGGARFTTNQVKRYGPDFKWKYLTVITCDDPAFTKNVALSLEWSIRYPTNRRPRPRQYNSPQGRLESLECVFSNPKFCQYKFSRQDF